MNVVLGKGFLARKEKGIFYTRLKKKFSKECRGGEGRDEMAGMWERLRTQDNKRVGKAGV